MRFVPCLVALVALSASASPPSIAVVDFTVVGSDARLGEVFAGRLASRLEERGAKVITQQTVRSLLSNERQRQLLGCAEEGTNCIAELAGALGSTYLGLGQVAKVGGSYTVNVRIVRSADGSTVSSLSKTVGSEDATLDAVTDAADAFIVTLDPTLAKPPVLPWVVTGVGAAAVIAGSVLMVRVADANIRLRGPVTPELSIEAAEQLARERAPEQVVGISLLVTGGVAIATGIIWWALSRNPRLTAWLVPTPGPGRLVWW
ncbi:MAG: FlgO family outer membrane protein [Myxococcota bacterium]